MNTRTACRSNKRVVIKISWHLLTVTWVMRLHWEGFVDARPLASCVKFNDSLIDMHIAYKPTVFSLCLCLSLSFLIYTSETNLFQKCWRSVQVIKLKQERKNWKLSAHAEKKVFKQGINCTPNCFLLSWYTCLDVVHLE